MPRFPPVAQLRDTILKYEEMAGLPSSQQLIDGLAAGLAGAQRQAAAEGVQEAEAGSHAAAAEQQPAHQAPAEQGTTAAGGQALQPVRAMEAGQAADAPAQGACPAAQGSTGAGVCGVDAAAAS